MSTSVDWHIERATDLVTAEVDGEMIGMHIANGTCYGFNGTAYRVWQLAAPPTRLSALAATMAQEYDVDLKTCTDQVKAVLEDLADDSLVRLSVTA